MKHDKMKALKKIFMNRKKEKKMKKLFTLFAVILFAVTLVACADANDTVLVDEAHDYYVTGNFAGWGDAAGNPTYKMEAIAVNDARVASIKSQLSGATGLYIIEVVLPSADAGWGPEYKVDGVLTTFNGNLTVKVIQTEAGDDIPNFWAQNPESGAITNLTPATLYIPPFVEENVDNAGTWNDNPVARTAGTYYLVFVIFQGSKGMALITK
jgi:hypothetical protein